MASRRMVPTRFFKDPDIMSLSSKDTQLILIGLTLAADDEGREVAHAGLLGREMDYPAEHIEAALQELVANDLVLLYQAGKHRYYQLTRWHEWQTLGGRFTPSRYPAPPNGMSEQPLQEDPSLTGEEKGKAGEMSGKTRGKSQHFPDQLNRSESNGTEDEGQAHTKNHPQKVLPFPPSRPVASNADHKGKECSDEKTQALTQHIASILKIPITDALTRLVTEYASHASLSLPGEADAAREWIDDPRKNRKRQRMSPAFFRRWLKREMEALERRQVTLQQEPTNQANGTTGSTLSTRDMPSTVGRRPPSLMHLAEEDQRAKGDTR